MSNKNISKSSDFLYNKKTIMDVQCHLSIKIEQKNSNASAICVTSAWCRDQEYMHPSLEILSIFSAACWQFRGTSLVHQISSNLNVSNIENESFSHNHLDINAL